ncbi:hypothetical protein CAPTEDRAFT_212003 [Capitella teleta]|uniref:Uncharacterized protein n=1 Tax=Capitella teleta TaxID=283909 RepID=R7TC56_CAPTE|nr:hypothetical protein CAPTEDRAFT_212003 [Capitella teleta]|eukprot:ELT91092.1 hypothetical protein CAPTEDRAFT_212003 [Capitella teleta]
MAKAEPIWSLMTSFCDVIFFGWLYQIIRITVECSEQLHTPARSVCTWGSSRSADTAAADPADPKLAGDSFFMASDLPASSADQMPSSAPFYRPVVLPPRDSESLRFFSGICSRQEAARRQALEGVCKNFENWLGGFGSPKELILPQANGGAAAGAGGGDLKALIVEQMPDLLRHAEMCPFPDARERCCDILNDLEVSVNVMRDKSCDSARGVSIELLVMVSCYLVDYVTYIQAVVTWEDHKSTNYQPIIYHDLSIDTSNECDADLKLQLDEATSSIAALSRLTSV